MKPPTQIPVILSEGAHGFIVSAAVEGPRYRLHRLGILDLSVNTLRCCCRR